MGICCWPGAAQSVLCGHGGKRLCMSPPPLGRETRANAACHHCCGAAWRGLAYIVVMLRAVRRIVCDVAAPCSLARRRWKARARRGREHAGVNAACCWGAALVAPARLGHTLFYLICETVWRNYVCNLGVQLQFRALLSHHKSGRFSPRQKTMSLCMAQVGRGHLATLQI